MAVSAQQAEMSVDAGPRPALLFVDDDPLIVESLSLALGTEFNISTAGTRAQARSRLQSASDPPSLALVDLGLPPNPHVPDEGFELINELLAFNPNMKILVLSGQSEHANIQHALTLGAVDFVPKPCDVPLLKSRLTHQLMMLDAEREQGVGEGKGGMLLGDSAAIRTLHELIRQFAQMPFPVLIQGESGSGKELVARYLHEQSPRADEPFLTINCAALPKDLLEAQLFGHAKGAFTGATQGHAGFFEEADSGSLLLDEIGDLPLDLQSKLLRVLENGEYYRLGETRPRKSSARIIAATNRELPEEVRSGKFRQDLYHRLGVLTVLVPPLREREDDCLLLLEKFKDMYAAGNPPFKLDQEARKFLQDYSFPGNVRELRNIVIRLSAKYAGRNVGLQELSNEVETDVCLPQSPAVEQSDEALERELHERAFRLDERMEEWERGYIRTALRLAGGNLSKAARLLGINRTTLYSRIQRLSIQVPE